MKNCTRSIHPILEPMTVDIHHNKTVDGRGSSRRVNPAQAVDMSQQSVRAREEIVDDSVCTPSRVEIFCRSILCYAENGIIAHVGVLLGMMQATLGNIDAFCDQKAFVHRLMYHLDNSQHAYGKTIFDGQYLCLKAPGQPAEVW